MGIINSYIIDKIEYLNRKYGINIQFITLVSIRGFFTNRKKIKALYPKSLILPHFPKTRFYALNLIFLTPVWLFWGSNKVIAKNIFSAALARGLKKIGLVKTLIYDAEGAAYSEKIEFGIGHSLTEYSIQALERRALQEANLIRTVSHKMPLYWQEQLSVNQSSYVVVPCTIGVDYLSVSLNSSDILDKRKEFGYSEEDTIFIYAGSFSPWQGFDLIDKVFSDWLGKHTDYKLIVLSNLPPDQLRCKQLFPKKVQVLYVNHAQVKDYLSISDYGLLLRHDFVTNQVAAPTKFAEYLACGLKVLISPNIGDYSAFVENHKCGLVVEAPEAIGALSSPSIEEKRNMQQLAAQHFTNESFAAEFQELISI